jgi:hypothetical protein
MDPFALVHKLCVNQQQLENTRLFDTKPGLFCTNHSEDHQKATNREQRR